MRELRKVKEFSKNFSYKYHSTCTKSNYLKPKKKEKLGKMKFGEAFTEYLHGEQDKFLENCRHVDYKTLKKVLNTCRSCNTLRHSCSSDSSECQCHSCPCKCFLVFSAIYGADDINNSLVFLKKIKETVNYVF